MTLLRDITVDAITEDAIPRQSHRKILCARR